MLTPAFELSQDGEFITILIKARFAKVSETEIFTDGNDFKFYSKPYFLRLNLPGKIVEDGREMAKYDVDKGCFVMKFPKETPGEHFEGLDMLTKLLAPKGQVSAAEPGIEVLQETDDSREDELDEEDFNWEVEQQPFLDDENNLAGTFMYGFGNRRSGVFERLQEELQDIVDLPDPDHTNLSDRKLQRKEAEVDKFDDDHYLADLFQDDMIQLLLEYEASWVKDRKRTENPESKELEESFFTEKEKEQMRKLPNKQYLLDKATEAEVYLGLVDVIYAYSYNARTTEEDNSVESAWTICKLSSTLSWLESFSSLHDVITTSMRRSLCYPLYRHWKLATKVLHDVITIFKLGRSQLLHCLLEVHQILSEDEPRYILNDLYITDYCVWIQSANQSKIASLAELLSQVTISKADVNLDLEELEAAAAAVQEESTEELNGGENVKDADAIHLHGYPHLLEEFDASAKNEQKDLITVLHEVESLEEENIENDETKGEDDLSSGRCGDGRRISSNADGNFNQSEPSSASSLSKSPPVNQIPCDICKCSGNLHAESDNAVVDCHCKPTSSNQPIESPEMELNTKLTSLNIGDEDNSSRIRTISACSGTEDSDDNSSSSSDDTSSDSDDDSTCDSDDLSS